MELTLEEALKVARLANLGLSKEELEDYRATLAEILDYVEQINKVETSSVEPTFGVSKQALEFREDEVVEGLSQAEALCNGGKVKNGFFVTKGVFEEE